MGKPEVNQDLYAAVQEEERQAYLGERQEASNRLRSLWEGLLLDKGERSELARAVEYSLWWEGEKQERVPASSLQRDLIEQCAGKLTHRLEMRFNDGEKEIPVTLYAIGYPLDRATLYLRFWEFYPFQFNDFVGEARRCIEIGPRSSGTAKLVEQERNDFEAENSHVFEQNMSLADIEALLRDFKEGQFEVFSPKIPEKATSFLGLGKGLVGKIRGKVAA